jgi:CheY-like chemotaxis protein
LGLGLSICQRISGVLQHPLGVRSRVGRGSVFSIRVPASDISLVRARPRDIALPRDDALLGLRVLCLDNDREILAGMHALLTRWGVEAVLATTVDEALQAAAAHRPDVLLVDYHLHDRADGLDALDTLRVATNADIRGALVTGDGSDALKQAARQRGYRVLTKPVKPASLRAFLAAGRIAAPA